MNVLLVPDKFKGSLTAGEVIEALGTGLRQAVPEVRIHSVLGSDGGDGFLDTIARYLHVTEIKIPTVDPLGRRMDACYLMDREEATAYVELARASGLVLLSSGERHPGRTSTLGTGIQIRHAIDNGARQVYIGLGGSATNDAGIGMAAALGYAFLDREGKVLEPIGNNVSKIRKITCGESRELLRDISIFAVNDVNNPLFGTHGATMVYGEQKGGGKKTLEKLEAGLQHLDSLVRRDLGKWFADVPGAGAAGGSAYGLKVFADASFISGIDLIFQITGIRQLLQQQPMDYIITGEGRIDEQTMSGKLIHGVLKLGKSHGIPVIAVCGSLGVERGPLLDSGLYAVLEVGDPGKSLEYNMKHASRMTSGTIRDFFIDRLRD